MTQVTYFGHSCFLVETSGAKVLFDPFITPNALAKEINLDSISCDYIFVSHGHEDHVADLEVLAKKTRAKVIGSWELHSWLNNKGINNTHPMNIGGTWDFGFAKVKMVYACHSNSLPDGRYGGTAAGYIFKNDETCFYYAGDTALTYDMKLIADDFKLDFAFLPIGSNFTMDAKAATKAAEFVNSKNVIGMHYDTFGFIKINHDDAKKEFADKDVKLTLMNIGEVIKK
ncbi:MAG: metal-dependent hydrolase [Bacteroidia bacterium]